MHMCGGLALNGTRVVGEEWVERTRAPQEPELSQKRAAFEANPFGASADPFRHSYSNQFWLFHGSVTGGVYQCSGIHGQHIHIDPLHECVIVKLSTQPEPKVMELWQQTFLGFEAITRAVSGDGGFELRWK